jgi:hypothetical protein
MANEEHLKKLMEGVDLSKANFIKSRLFQTDLYGAQLRSSLFVGSKLIRVNLNKAVISSADFKESRLDQVMLRVVPKTNQAAWWVMAEIIIGYVMLGGLIAIFSNKLARRA